MGAIDPILRACDYVRYNKQSRLDDNFGWCDACGAVTPYRFLEVVNEKLAMQWKLSTSQRRFMSSRESRYCDFCGCSYRLRMLARALRGVIVKSSASSLRQSIRKRDFDGLRIAEINSCGKLHDILQELPGIAYSEYQPLNSEVAHQDLMGLTYADESFNIVMTSDTLEHVPDVDRALREIFRVLKPGGVHLFTIPWLLTRKTLTRTILGKKDKPQHIQPASFHGSGEPDYLVWNEFGFDFLNTSTSVGFDTTVLFQNLHDLDEPSSVLLARKSDGKTRTDSTINIDETISSGERSELANMLKNAEVLSRLAYKPGISNRPSAYNTIIDTKVGKLADKLALTEDHAANQADEIKALYTEIGKLHRFINDIQQELNSTQKEHRGVQSSRARRIYSKVSRVIKGKENI